MRQKGSGMNWEIGIDIYARLCIKQTTNENHSFLVTSLHTSLRVSNLSLEKESIVSLFHPLLAVNCIFPNILLWKILNVEKNQKNCTAVLMRVPSSVCGFPLPWRTLYTPPSVSTVCTPPRVPLALSNSLLGLSTAFDIRNALSLVLVESWSLIHWYIFVAVIRGHLYTETLACGLKYGSSRFCQLVQCS